MIYDNIERNKRNSVLLLFFMALFAVGVCGFIGFYFFDNWVVGVLVGIGISFLSSGASYYSGDKIILATVRAQKATIQHHQILLSVVGEMALAAGIPTPQVYVIPDQAPNAFATGRDPEHASVAVTNGLLQRLNRAELQGVIAHEMSHILNRDILFVTIVSVLVGAVIIISSIYRTSLWFGGGRRSRDSNGGNLTAIIGLILIIFAPFAGKVIQMSISRQREYLADSNAALLTRNPQSLADALRKISSTQTKSTIQNSAVNPLFIAEPFKGIHAAELFSTHPPIEKRIERLLEMSYAPIDLTKGVINAD